MNEMKIAAISRRRGGKKKKEIYHRFVVGSIVVCRAVNGIFALNGHKIPM